jgi:IclR family acetate operon transcriptional repressor
MKPTEKSENTEAEVKVLEHSTGTLGKAMEALDIVASQRQRMRFTDILERTDQPRGTLHRQLSNLIEEGLLDLRPDMTYELGYKLLKYASQAWAGNEFRNIAEPHLKHLHDQTGETVHLGVLRNNEVIYLDKVEGTHSVRMYSQIGNASPVYCTGVGKAALSVLEGPALESCLATIKFHKFTENTLMSSQALRSELEDIRSCGNAYDREEHEIGISCVAAPVHSQDLTFLAGISVTGPAYRVSQEKLAGWAELVRHTAHAIMDDMQTRLGPRA